MSIDKSCDNSSCCDSSCKKSDDPTFLHSRIPGFNKGTSFTEKERKDYKLNGLYPAGVLSLDVRVDNALKQLEKKTSNLEKYIYLHTIQDADETLFYAILMQNMTKIMPIVYTPTVGEACTEWSHITRSVPRGIYLSLNDIGNVENVLKNHLYKDVDVIVVTDGERILGLGDLGANGMGIPIGKLALYSACAGIHPLRTLPVHIDVGTNNEDLLDDPTYVGLRQKRERGEVYDQLVDEFITASQSVFGEHVLIQFEDFGNTNAFRLIKKHQMHACTFNDDIQGTAAVAVAGMISSLPLTKMSHLKDHIYLFSGAGEAGAGIANLLSTLIQQEANCSIEEARERIWLFDSKGLIHKEREGKLEDHKKPFAHSLRSDISGNNGSTLVDAIELIKPTALIGVSAQGGSFTAEVLRAMTKHSDNPLIFALSNPTSKSECTAQEAYDYTDGKAVFASGSPFDHVVSKKGDIRIPGQGNNAYIFPGLGLAAVASGAKHIVDEDFAVAAKSLAKQVTEATLATGCIYPPLEIIRDVSAQVAADVVDYIVSTNRATKTIPNNMSTLDYCKSIMYTPSY